eukprot:COSAG02_NODE_28_length_51367_cov_70.053932_31_plen_243_part_00
MLRLPRRLEGTARASPLLLLPLLCGGLYTIGQVASSSGQASMSAVGDNMLDSSHELWNGEVVARELARSVLGWNPYMDVVGAGVYGGIVKRDPATGSVLLGHEWPENNADWAYGPHNNVAPHKGMKSPFLDMSQYTQTNRGYAHISNLVTSGDARALQQLFEQLGDDRAKRKTLANLVMAGGARPLHMAGMTHGGNPKEVVRILIGEGADPNAMDAYAMTPLDRMLSNRVSSSAFLCVGLAS